MKLIVLGLLALVLFAAACDHSAARVDTTQPERELLTLQDEWAAARIKGDVAFLERFYAQELRLQVMNGHVVKRNDDIAMFDRVHRGDKDTIKPEYIKDEDLQVSVHGDTAFVTGVENLKGTARGMYGEMALRFTNIFVRRDGRWQLVLHHSTRVQGK